jgi:heat shock protein beta
MKAQTLGDNSQLEYMMGQQVLEINPNHAMIEDLNVKQTPIAKVVRIEVSLMCVDNIMPCFLSHVELCVHNSVPAFFVSQFVCKDRPRSPKAKQLVELLYETALMSSGFTPDNPPEFGSKVYEMMALALAAWRAASDNLHSNHQISSSASQGRKKRQSPTHLLQI